MKVGMVMGSVSDWPVMKEAEDVLTELGIEVDKRILSAHRTPAQLAEWVDGAEESDIRVFIAGAGGAAHLAGCVAALTVRPVIGVPVKAKVLDGLDSLLSMVQMPSGIPVATVSINGARNAGLLAAQMLALHDSALAERLRRLREKQAEKVLSTQFPD